MAEPPRLVLETALYAEDLDAVEAFYGGALGLERIGARGGSARLLSRRAGGAAPFQPRGD
jgi:catechol 2,3-dioxygenase-like lactoylglutathione lyase family enzyme